MALPEMFIEDVNKMVLKIPDDVNFHLPFMLADKRYFSFCSVFNSDCLHLVDDSIPNNIKEAWKNVYMNNQYVSDILGISLTDTITIFNQLKSQGMIYPNGVVHSLIQTILIKKHNSFIKNIRSEKLH